MGKASSGRVALIGTMAMMTGIFGLIGGMLILMLTALLSFLQFDLFGFSPSSQTAVALGLLLGFVVMVSGVVWVVAGAGFLKGRRLGTNWGVTATVLSILGALASAGLGFYWLSVGLVAWTLVLLYLTRANVITLTGQPGRRALISSQGRLSASRAVTSLESLVEAESNIRTSEVRKCQNCGAMVAAGTTVCQYCGAPA